MATVVKRKRAIKVFQCFDNMMNAPMVRITMRNLRDEEPRDFHILTSPKEARKLGKALCQCAAGKLPDGFTWEL